MSGFNPTQNWRFTPVIRRGRENRPTFECIASFSVKHHRADQTVSVPGNAKRLPRDLDETRDLRRLGLKNVQKYLFPTNLESVLLYLK
jgi:hypothetical protein